MQGLTVPTSECPGCQRTWPVVSEQGQTMALYGVCFACVVQEVSKAVEPLRGQADYVIQNCKCFGKKDCPDCDGFGWIAEPKPV